MTKRIRHASRFLRSNDRTAAFLAVIDHNRRLLQAIRDKLPPPLDSHCLHASLEDGLLTLMTDSPVWGSRLRFFAPELTQVSVPEHGQIEKCRVRVTPSHGPHPSPRGGARINVLSEGTVALLLEAAGRQGETELGAALRRLAKAGAARD